MKTRVIAAFAVLALLIPAAAFAASGPKLSSDLIVPNKSLGGLTLNAPASTATKIFGATSCSTGGCTYSSVTGGWTLEVVFATKTKTSKPYIALIAFSESKPSSSAPALKTAAGIGIGSSAIAIKKAYPKLLGSASTSLYTSETKYPLTVYTLYKGHLSGISMRAVALG